MIRAMRLLLCCVLLLTCNAVSWGGDTTIGIPDDAWPTSWFFAPVSSSAAGIKTFQESPFLAERVANGSLPPVEDRLPDDPVVIEPFTRIGTYGGTLKVFKDG
jgi:hypothetical protein